MSSFQQRKALIISLYSLLIVVIGGSVIYGVYKFKQTNDTLSQTETLLSQKLSYITELEDQRAALEEQNEELGGTLKETRQQKDDLDLSLEDQKKQNEELEDEKDDLQKERDMLEKLAKTDKQLLAKYSKVYFLNENYSPIKLDTIDSEFTLPAGKKLQFLDPALPYLEDLLEDAKDDKIAMRVVSAYRSFETQAALKSAYTLTYGAGANTFSADQGYSEHQLGTTVDFTTPSIASASSAFEGTSAFTWLQNNAYKYGFVLSYPKNNAYYIYEPWHWRFVGKDLAKDLHRQGKNFYDLSQRDLDEYLVKIFD